MRTGLIARTLCVLLLVGGVHVVQVRAVGASMAERVRGGDEIERIGERLRAALKPLRELPATATSTDRLRALETCLTRLKNLRAAVAKLPNRLAGPRDRIRFHLDYLIKWNRYLTEQAGGAVTTDAERDRERARADYRDAQSKLAAARAFERANPADRLAIADRYLAVLERLRGTPEERWIVDRLNRLWAEVRPAGSAPDTGRPVAGSPGSGSPVAKGGEGAGAPKSSAGGAESASPGAGTERTEPLDAEALKALREQARTGSADERSAALRTIAQQKRAWASTFLVACLEKEADAGVQRLLEGLIRGRGDRPTLKRLGRWARRREAADRQRAIALIAAIDHKDAGKTLARFAKEKEPKVVTALIDAATKMPEGRGVEVLADLLKRRAELRSELILALGTVRHPDAGKPLLSFLHRRKFPELKLAATRAFRTLGVYGIPTLIGALDGRDYRQYAASTLRTVTGQRFGMSRSRWEGWWRKNKRRLESEAAANPR